jgi:hypothetical protein
VTDGARLDAEAIRRLPKKPVIEEANYGWTGRLADHPCLLVGDRELDYDRARKASVLDTRKWLALNFSAPQIRRSRRFHEVAAASGSGILIYVYRDIGMGVTSTGEHQAKRGERKFVGWFELVEQGEQDGRSWLLAVLRERG